MKTMREYMNTLDEIARGAFIDPTRQTAVRPKNQDERDLLAKGLKAARAFNRQDANYYSQTDKPDAEELNAKKLAARGYRSASIKQPDMYGVEYEKGMPVDIGANQKWQTGVVTGKRPLEPKFASTVTAKDGKSSGMKKPAMPW